MNNNTNGTKVETKTEDRDKISKILQAAWEALVTEDGERKPLTLSAIALVNEALLTGHPDALVLQGILRFVIAKEEPTSLSLFLEAERKGSKHFLLPYYIAECYRRGTEGADKDHVKATQYYELAIAGPSKHLDLLAQMSHYISSFG